MAAEGLGPALRVGFAGTPALAAVALQALLQAGYAVPLVLTQPDRPAGRGLQPQASAVKVLALAQGLTVAQPRSLRLDGRWPDDARAAQEHLAAAALDVLVVAAYGLILPPWVLALPTHGCVNIHASLLPRWRGAAPIARAIEAGDACTGVTIMQMDAGLDTGPMWCAQAVPITPQDTSATMHERLAELGAHLLLQVLPRLGATGPGPQPQPADGDCYAAKIDKAEALLDWSQPATVLERRLRAFDPFPGCTATVEGQPLKLWRAQVVEAQGQPGVRLDAYAGRLVIGCGRDALELLEVQRPGGRRMSAAAWLQHRQAQPPAPRGPVSPHR